MSQSSGQSSGTDEDPLAGLPPVTQHDIEEAMAVNSVPDEVRMTSDSTDETEQVMDATGRLTGPADESVGDQHLAPHPDVPRAHGEG